MTMSYDGALVMPSSYAVMDTEEMTYVGGGFEISKTWYGYSGYFNASECADISALLTAGSGIATIGGAIAGFLSCGAGALIGGALAGEAAYNAALFQIGANHRGIGFKTLGRVKTVFYVRW